MFGTDPSQMERRLSQWTQGFIDRADRFHAMRAQLEQVQVTESSKDGVIRVTVDSTGALTDLVLGEKIRDLSPPELATQVLACLRRAQQQLAPLVRDTMQAVVGGEEPFIKDVVSKYRERFGESPRPPSTTADPGVLGLGMIEDDTMIEHAGPRRHPGRPAEPSRRYRRATPPDDEEYFADRGYLR